jgi:ketosteroid isomerase-like protein
LVTNRTDTPIHISHGRAQVPADLPRLFAAFVNAGDVDDLVTLFEFDAVCVPQPTVLVHGPAGLSNEMSRLCRSGAKVDVTSTEAHVASDLALMTSRWLATNSDGSTFGGRATAVARKQPDGRWLYVIADPRIA